MQREQREREFTKFYAGSAAALRRTAYVVVRDWHVAEDLTQQTFAKLYVAWPRVRVELATIAPARLWFVQTVKVIKSESLVTHTEEPVHTPTREAAESAFQVPVTDLVEIGTDPVLVIPEPPTDDSGCGPWALDAGVSYC